jgi:hypothetical protein
VNEKWWKSLYAIEEFIKRIWQMGRSLATMNICWNLQIVCQSKPMVFFLLLFSKQVKFATIPQIGNKYDKKYPH